MKILNYGSMNIDNVYSVEHMARYTYIYFGYGPRRVLRREGAEPVHCHCQAGGQVCHAGIVGEDGGMLLDALHAAKVDTACVRRGRRSQLPYGDPGGCRGTEQHYRLWRGKHAPHRSGY